MRNILLFLTLMTSIVCFAGEETLNDGKTIVYWKDTTQPVAYNSYSVDVRLSNPYSKNVWGSVALYHDGYCVESKNFMIKIGEKRTDVDFENLSNNIRYEVIVTVDGK